MFKETKFCKITVLHKWICNNRELTKETYLQGLTMLNSPSVENPEHLSSFKPSSLSNLALAKTS